MQRSADAPRCRPRAVARPYIGTCRGTSPHRARPRPPGPARSRRPPRRNASSWSRPARRPATAPTASRRSRRTPRRRGRPCGSPRCAGGAGLRRTLSRNSRITVWPQSLPSISPHHATPPMAPTRSSYLASISNPPSRRLPRRISYPHGGRGDGEPAPLRFSEYATTR